MATIRPITYSPTYSENRPADDHSALGVYIQILGWDQFTPLFLRGRAEPVGVSEPIRMQGALDVLVTVVTATTKRYFHYATSRFPEVVRRLQKGETIADLLPRVYTDAVELEEMSDGL